MSRLRNINHFEYVEPGTHTRVESKSSNYQVMPEVVSTKCRTAQVMEINTKCRTALVFQMVATLVHPTRS